MALALAGCSAEPAANQADPAAPVNAAANTAPAPAPDAPTAALAVDGDGLRLFDPATGASRPLAFGADRATVLAALESRGTPETGRMEECGPGPLDFALWSDGLKLYFQDGRLAGWALDERARGKLATVAGVGPGASRAELAAAHPIEIAETSLGTEFASADLYGLLDGPGQAAKVTAMWGGASCVFR